VLHKLVSPSEAEELRVLASDKGMETEVFSRFVNGQLDGKQRSRP